MTASIFRRRALLLAACATTAITVPAFAQDGAAPQAPEDVVIVTATRRDQALQDVPVAVTALSAAQLSDAGVRTIQDLTQLAPSLNVPQSENSASVTARIRGVGTQGSNPGLESSVGVFVDGVYRARNGVAFGDLGELSAVEVLRGPQGTLFGRNTSAGLLNVSSKKPSFDPGATVEANFGNYTAGNVALGFTGPLSDTLAYRMFASYQTRDGWMTANPNQPGERDANVRNYYTVRGQLLWRPNDNLEGRFIADLSERSEDCCSSVVYLPGPTVGLVNRLASLNGAGFQGTSAVATTNSYESFSNRTYDQTVEDKGVSAEFNLDVGPGRLTSITAWRNWEWRYSQDSDFTGLDIIYRDKAEGPGNEFTTFTQEVRYAGQTGRVDWLVGAFYSDETIDRKDTFRVGNDYAAYFGALLGANVPAAAGGPISGATASYAQLAGVPVLWQTLLGIPAANRGNYTAGGGLTDFYTQEATSIALFTHNIVEISDRMSATIGLRYTSEDKDFRADYSTTGVQACRGFEQTYGLDPAAFMASVPALAGGAAVAGTLCQPFWRSGLDALDHRQSRTEREWSGIATLAYEITDDINTYVTYSRGYKAGGFNLDRAFSDARGNVVSGAPGSQTVRGADTSFAAEFVDSVEYGVKTQFFERALTMNLALYYQKFENFQLNTFTGISFIVTAVPEVISKGFELDFRYRTPVDGLVFGGGFAHTDAAYGDNLGSVSNPATFLGQNRNLFLLPGSQLTSSPRQALSLNGEYTMPVGAEWELGFYVDTRWSSEYNGGSNLDPRKIQGEITMVNSRITLGSNDGMWDFEIWGRNLLDERYAQIVFDQFAQGSAPNIGGAPNFTQTAATSTLGAFVGEPLTVGLGLKMRF